MSHCLHGDSNSEVLRSKEIYHGPKLGGFNSSEGLNLNSFVKKKKEKKSLVKRNF